MAKKQKKRINYFAIIIIGLIVGFMIWNYHSIWVVKQLSTSTVRQGWVKHEQTLQAIFANTEIVLTAPEEGRVTFIQEEEGRRFKKGETVAVIKPTGVDNGPDKPDAAVSAPIAGLFYSLRDGLEGAVTPENLMNMDLEALLSQVQNSKESLEKGSDQVSKNAPLGKMVNNLYPSWMFVHLEDNLEMVKDSSVRFIIEGEEYTGTVMKVSAKPRGAVIRFSQYIKGTVEKRSQEVIWSYRPATKGLIVPVGALCTFGEEQGVYVSEQGVIRFRNVKVLDTNESSACVEGLPEGAQVVVNPRGGIEGLPLR